MNALNKGALSILLGLYRLAFQLYTDAFFIGTKCGLLFKEPCETFKLQHGPDVFSMIRY